MNIKVGQGIRYQAYDKSGLVTDKFALVVDVTESEIVAVPVKAVSLWNGHDYQKAYVCYDELGAEYPRDKDNVRLQDCPPPFSDVTHLPGNLFAYAALDDMQKLLVFDEEKCKKYHVEIVDEGKKISKRDMKNVLNHPWIDQLQKQKLHDARSRGIAELESRLGLNQDDMESPQDDVEFE